MKITKSFQNGRPDSKIGMKITKSFQMTRRVGHYMPFAGRFPGFAHRFSFLIGPGRQRKGGSNKKAPVNCGTVTQNGIVNTSGKIAPSGAMDISYVLSERHQQKL